MPDEIQPSLPPLAPKKRPKPPGRKKGSLNKRTKFKSIREDLEKAWEELGGSAIAKRLLKQGIRDAEGFDTVEKEYAFPKDENGNTQRVLLKEKVKHIKDTALLNLLVPYFIQRVPQQQEVTGAGGAPLVPPAPALPPIDLSALSTEQLDRFIAATASAAVAVRTQPPISPDPAGGAVSAAGTGTSGSEGNPSTDESPAPAAEPSKDTPSAA